MRILALSTTHDASVAILEDGKLIYYRMAERLTRNKHDFDVSKILEDLMQFNNLFFDAIVIVNNIGKNLIDEVGSKIINFVFLNFLTDNFILTYTNHHIFHAYLAFYNSNFDSATCIVVDGKGNVIDNNTLDLTQSYKKNDVLFCERESIFFFNNDFNKIILKNYYMFTYDREINIKNYYNFFEEYKINNKIKNSTYAEYNNFHVYDLNQHGIAQTFEYVEEKIGFIDYTKPFVFQLSAAGKVMGLAQYKGYEDDLKSPYNTDYWKESVSLANETQKSTQERMINLIKYGIEKTNNNNVIITGGYGLNCVANYFYLKEIPNINLYIDPIPFDAGQSIGAAYYYHKLLAKDIPIQKLENVYIGHKEESYKLNNEFNNKKVKYEDIVELLIKGKIVCIFQGQSEAGQRALGNRSFLFDPRINNGKDIVNSIKKRENFRPFAGSILLEHVHDWFDMRGLEESSYMQFAVDTKKDKIDLIPAVVHVDGTCRIQTVTEKQNFHLYNLIKTFYNKTNVPILLNTSFNLAGDPLVETLDHAYDTLKRSELKYLYLPEIETLVYK